MLTQPEFAQKVKDLIKHNGHLKLNDVNLLKLGRHFRLSEKAKLVVGKNDEENRKIIALASPGDLLILTDSVPGPASLLRGEFSEKEREIALRIIAYYVHKSPSPEVPFLLQYVDEGSSGEKISAPPLERALLEKFRIG